MADGTLSTRRRANKSVDALVNDLPFLVYGIRQNGRIVYIGRGSSNRAQISAREKGGEVVIIEAHASEQEMIDRERYWIACLAPELNKKPGEMRSMGVRDAGLQLPYQIKTGGVMFSLWVPIELAYSYYDLAQKLEAFAGRDHAKAREFEALVEEATQPRK